MIIRIKNLRLRAIIGVNPWEKEEAQTIIINVELEFDGSKAIDTDKLEDTIDYGEISRKITQHAESTTYELIESLAGNLLNIVMEDHRIKRAQVEVDKPNAIYSADSAAVEVSTIRK